MGTTGCEFGSDVRSVCPPPPKALTLTTSPPANCKGCFGLWLLFGSRMGFQEKIERFPSAHSFAHLFCKQGLITYRLLGIRGTERRGLLLDILVILAEVTRISWGQKKGMLTASSQSSLVKGCSLPTSSCCLDCLKSIVILSNYSMGQDAAWIEQSQMLPLPPCWLYDLQKEA